MKTKPKFFLIEQTIFPYDILITVSSDEELIRYIENKKKYKLNDKEKTALEMEGRGRTVMLEGGQTIIRLKKQQTSIGIDLCDLVHEVEHAVYFIFERIGITHTYQSDEVFAYYQAYIIRKALGFFDKE